MITSTLNTITPNWERILYPARIPKLLRCPTKWVVTSNVMQVLHDTVNSGKLHASFDLDSEAMGIWLLDMASTWLLLPTKPSASNQAADWNIWESSIMRMRIIREESNSILNAEIKLGFGGIHIFKGIFKSYIYEITVSGKPTTHLNFWILQHAEGIMQNPTRKNEITTSNVKGIPIQKVCSAQDRLGNGIYYLIV